MLHAGLNRDLKHLSIYHCEKIKVYDEFKKELRKLESSLKDSNQSEANVCKAAAPSSEMTEIKQLLTKMNERKIVRKKSNKPSKTFIEEEVEDIEDTEVEVKDIEEEDTTVNNNDR